MKEIDLRVLGLVILLIGAVFFIGSIIALGVIFEKNSSVVEEEHPCYDKYGRVIEGLKCYEKESVLNEDLSNNVKIAQKILGILCGFGLIVAIIGIIFFVREENRLEKI